MAEVADRSIGVREWEVVWNKPDGANGIPMECITPQKPSARAKTSIANTHEFYLDIHRTRLFEHGALIPTDFVVAGEHQ